MVAMRPPKNTGKDIDILGFVKRDNFIVLQTTQDYFENLTTVQKIENVAVMIKSLAVLDAQLKVEMAEAVLG